MKSNSKQFLYNLVFSVFEISYVENATANQWESENWFLHNVGFILASKCKNVFTQQSTLKRIGTTETTALATYFGLKPSRKLPQEPRNPRDWGLVKEVARRPYQSVVRSCKCSPNCGIVIVEYNCPWVHKNSEPKGSISFKTDWWNVYWKFLNFSKGFQLLLPSANAVLCCLCKSLTLLSGKPKESISIITFDPLFIN